MKLSNKADVINAKRHNRSDGSLVVEEITKSTYDIVIEGQNLFTQN